MRKQLNQREYTGYVGLGRSGDDCTTSIGPRHSSGVGASEPTWLRSACEREAGAVAYADRD